ncbi:type I polyketide synthase [Amycolatopsis sp. NPDC003676]
MSAELRAVADAVAAVLRGPADPDTPWQELGLTSLMLTRVKVRIERALARRIAAHELVEHSTITALARHLAGESPKVLAGQPAAATDNRVAVVGMASRFPGAADVEAFWRNLRAGVCSVGVPLTGVDAFDAGFFGITPDEAERTDPAHRLLLEHCHLALEDGGHAAARDDVRVGVYAGCGMNLYGPQPPYFSRAAHTDDPVEAIMDLIGGQADFLATRVAYRLGLTGPAVTVQTACSTSLVAVHLAVQAVLTGDCDLALAGAAAVRYTPNPRYVHSPGYILSPTGRCRVFDAESDGVVGGDGVGVVLLKRLDRALADGDTVHAVIIGSAINNDGRDKPGFTAPSVRGHADVVRAAMARAGVEPNTIGHIEAHGTGTSVGDPVEFEALSRALADDGHTGFCALGSVKSSVGHLDTCAGMAGLIKTVLMLRHSELVPVVGTTRPNPALPWERSPFYLSTECARWKSDGTPLRAGVSALGFGGTNAHVVLEQSPRRSDRTSDGDVLVAISADDEDSLTLLTQRLRDTLVARPAVRVVDVAATLGAGRPHRPWRVAVSGRDAAGLVSALDRADFSRPPRLGSLTFVFSGQGAEVPHPADYSRFPAFRAVIAECEALLDRPQVAHFAFQVALARTWLAAGVAPDCVVGHSLGELTALCVAGALSLSDGLRLVAARDRLMRATEPGLMLAVSASLDDTIDMSVATGTDLAAANGPNTHVLSGRPDAIARAEAALDEIGISHRRLAVDRAFHSRLLDPVLDELAAVAARARWQPLRVPLSTAVDGELLPAGWTPGPEFVARHARLPVLFDQALRALGSQDFVEIASGPVLAGAGKRTLPGSFWLSQYDNNSLAELYRRGAELDWAALTSGGGRVPLPGHPLRPTRFPWT